MAAGMADALQIELIPGELSAAEQAWAAELAHGRYANPEWTGRV